MHLLDCYSFGFFHILLADCPNYCKLHVAFINRMHMYCFIVVALIYGKGSPEFSDRSPNLSVSPSTMTITITTDHELGVI